MNEKFDGEKFVTGRDGGDYYSGFYVDWLEAKLENECLTRKTIEEQWDALREDYNDRGAKLDEATRLLNEAQHYVSHANYDLYLAIQIDEFLGLPKVIES